MSLDPTPDQITMRRPDDWHVHLRDGAMLPAVLPCTAAQFARIRPVPERMEQIGMPLLIHGGATDPEVDIFDREAVFVEGTLTSLLVGEERR
ncbi:MAG TPA: hypothetical protein VNR89_10960 [Roseomonas sp.]|nr:hypothetical protein [Roseomonas sp.]